MRLRVINFSIIFFFFLGVGFIPIVSGKKFPELFSTRSENKEDVAAFPVTRRIMVLSVGEPPTAGFSIEMSDLSDDSSRSSVLVEVAKSRPSSTGVDLLVNLLFPFPSVPDPARFSSALPTFPFRLRIAFDSLFQPIRLKNSFPSCSDSSWFFQQKGSFTDFLCFFDINFHELIFSLGILDVSRLILIYCFFVFTHLATDYINAAQ